MTTQMRRPTSEMTNRMLAGATKMILSTWMITKVVFVDCPINFQSIANDKHSENIYLSTKRGSVAKDVAYRFLRSEYSRIFDKASEQFESNTVLKRRLADIPKIVPHTGQQELSLRDEEEWVNLLRAAQNELQTDFKKYAKDLKSIKRHADRDTMLKKMLIPARDRLNAVTSCLRIRNRIAEDLKLQFQL